MQAVWTKPFMRQGVAMASALGDGHNVVANMGAGGKVSLAAKKSSASVTDADVYACKGFVQTIDSVLIPWDMKGYGI